MLRIIATPREILCFPRYECGWPLAWHDVPWVTSEQIKKLDARAFHKKKPSVGVELRAGENPHMSEKPGWSGCDMRQWPKRKENKKCIGIRFLPWEFCCQFNFWFVQSQQNNYKVFDFFKVSKTTTKFLCSFFAKLNSLVV